MSSSLKFCACYACPCLQSMVRTFKIFFVIFKFSNPIVNCILFQINRCSICMKLSTTLLHTAKLNE